MITRKVLSTETYLRTAVPGSRVWERSHGEQSALGVGRCVCQEGVVLHQLGERGTPAKNLITIYLGQPRGHRETVKAPWIWPCG